MKKLVLILFLPIFVFAQEKEATNKEIALQKGIEAVQLMDIGQIDESIKLLKESQELDPDNINYPYEIAFAYQLKKEHQTAIEILEGLKLKKDATDMVYQALGNNYDILGYPEKAIQTYDEGLKRFPNSGRLYFEKGVVYEIQEEFDKAIKLYQDGVDIDSKFSSTYYRLAKLFLRSDNIVPGLIYGEIFMNLERSARRTIEMSELLYGAYKNAIIFNNDSTVAIDFCDLKINVDDLKNEIRIPFCGIFGYNFIRSTIQFKEFNLTNFSKMRFSFLNSYFENHAEQYPNFLLQYLKIILDEGWFEEYNHYLFQMGSPSEFEAWYKVNENVFNQFVEWYTAEENIINPTRSNHYRFEY